jgi:malonic semialdehyde reductase
MYKIIQPSEIIFGLNSAKNYLYPPKCLVITSQGSKKRNWIDYLGLEKNDVFDLVEPNPSMETVNHILSKFDFKLFSTIIGLGGGSSLDVAKYVAFKTNKKKIMIPTTFGSGSEVTKVSVLQVDGKKTSFHNDDLLADVSIIDPYFIKNTPFEIIKNSAIDACAQCTEAFDSKLANTYTKFLCGKAFDILEKALIDETYENLAYGAMISGLGFGNSSTTLGHALSYVYSNEGISHGHALSFSTTVAHKFNNSKFYDRFKFLVNKLNFKPIKLKQNLIDATKLIQTDRKHLDYNPKNVSDGDIVKLLELINSKS